MKSLKRALTCILTLAVAALICVSVGLICKTALAKADGGKVIYVTMAGAGTKDGSSPENAAMGMTNAIKMFGSEDGTLVVCGAITLSNAYTEPAHTGHITITCIYDGVDYRETSSASFTIGNSYRQSGPITFDDITLTTSGATRLFIANGYSLTFGEGVECEITGAGGSAYPYVFGGTSNTSGNTTISGGNVTIAGGHFYKVSAGNRYVNDSVDGDVSLTVTGGIIDTYVCGTGAGKTTGNVSVNVSGGYIKYGVYGIDYSSGRTSTVTGDVSVTISGGDLGGAVALAKNDAKTTFNGAYNCYINTDKLDSVSDIRGAMNVSGENTSNIVYSEDIDAASAPEAKASYKNAVTTGADPWVIYHNGYYYMAVVRGASITIAKALTVADLGRAEPVAVWTATNNTVVDDSIWSPELHYFSAEEFGEEHAGWYLYFACPDADHPDDNFYRRSYALRALTDDPQGAWGSPVDKTPNIPTRIEIDSDNSSWNIGPSIFRINGKIYMTWTGRIFEYYGTHTQNLNIALMTNPYSIDLSTKAIICEPTETWEKYGATYSSSTEKNSPEVVEGATAVYGDNGEVWCIYSASGYWTDHYALAQLRYLGGDPCDINNWKKCSSPIFKQNSEVYGPGHASYTKGHDGTRYFIYHGYLEPASVEGRHRSIFIEEFTISANNVVLGSGTPKALSKTNYVANTPLSLKDRTSGFFRDVYVSATGNDAYDGSNADKAIKTLDRAFALLPDGGRIILTGTSYDIGENYSTPASDAEYILTSRLIGSDYNAGIVTYKGTLNLNSDFVIEKIRFKGSSTPIIVCNGHNVTFGKSIQNDANSYIVGGVNLVEGDSVERGNLTNDYTITIESGVWVSLFGGNRRVVGEAPCSTISGDINIIIDGATFKISTTVQTANQNSISGMNSTTGDINLTVKSGEFYSGIFLIGRIGTGGSSIVHTGNVNVKLLGGKFNVSGTGANNATIDVCQDSDTILDGNYTIEISENATIGYKSIGASGVDGVATLYAPAALVDKAADFDKIIIPSTLLYGDVDANESVANADITLLVRLLSGWVLPHSEQNADINGDGRLTNRDAILLSQKLAGWN